MTGTLHRDGDQPTLRFERFLKHPIERVWRAISEPEGLAAWFPAAIHGERRAGAELSFVFEGEAYPSYKGRMITFEPPHVMEFDWNDERLRFVLSPDGTGTRLVFTHTFPDLGKSARDAAGWTFCFDALDAHLDGRPAPEGSPDTFERLFTKFAAEFGPDASTKKEPDA